MSKLLLLTFLLLPQLIPGQGQTVQADRSDESSGAPAAPPKAPSATVPSSDLYPSPSEVLPKEPEDKKPVPLVPMAPLNVPPPPPGKDDYVVSSDVELVLLDVSVKDSNGGFATGLEKDNFRVYENGKPEEVSVFAAKDVPVTVGLVVDNSGSVRPKRPEIVTAALTFASRSNPKDEMFVVNFNDRVSLGLKDGTAFTDDLPTLRAALLSNPARGRTALNDALKLALEHLELGRRDKKTLVLVSDGGDNASETTDAEVLRLAEESTATIYTIGIFDDDDKDKNPGFLKKLATITGGEYFHPEELPKLVAVCDKIAKDIRNRYTLGYTPSNRNFDGSVRKLKVTASASDRGKLFVRTRTHYVAAKGQMARKNHRH